MGFLILVRHSTSSAQSDVSAHEWALTDEGREKAKGLAQRVHRFGVRHIVSSDEPKAVETAQVLAADLGSLSVGTHSGLRETHRRTAPYFQDRGDFSRAIHQAMQRPSELLYGEETFGNALTRFTNTIEGCIAEHRDDTHVIVSHGTILSLYIAHLTGLDAFAIWNLLDMPAYALFRLEDRKLCEICFSLA